MVDEVFTRQEPERPTGTGTANGHRAHVVPVDRCRCRYVVRGPPPFMGCDSYAWGAGRGAAFKIITLHHCRAKLYRMRKSEGGTFAPQCGLGL